MINWPIMIFKWMSYEIITLKWWEKKREVRTKNRKRKIGAIWFNDIFALTFALFYHFSPARIFFLCAIIYILTWLLLLLSALSLSPFWNQCSWPLLSFHVILATVLRLVDLLLPPRLLHGFCQEDSRVMGIGCRAFSRLVFSALEVSLWLVSRPRIWAEKMNIVLLPCWLCSAARSLASHDKHFDFRGSCRRILLMHCSRTLCIIYIYIIVRLDQSGVRFSFVRGGHKSWVRL